MILKNPWSHPSSEWYIYIDSNKEVPHLPLPLPFQRGPCTVFFWYILRGVDFFYIEIASDEASALHDAFDYFWETLTDISGVCSLFKESECRELL